ncbi:MAG: alpha/beta hydrolase family protein [Oscillospiraceae bacterium]|nr:alpha/beta hydrolase family protein [Oscillospiraceae bacterium]
MALMHVDFFAKTLGMAMSMDVILPEGEQGIGVNARPVWDGQEELPVLYLLHGTSDDHTIWQRRTSIERYAAGKKLAVVMPAAHISAYTNQKFGFRFFDFIADETPAFCQKYFKISADREKNFICGLSMGGYGALKIGMRCGDRFGYAAGLSSGCDRMSLLPPEVRALPDLAALAARREELEPAVYDRAVQFFLNFGSPAQYEASGEDNLFRIAEERTAAKLPMPEIFMACGTEDFALEPNRRFHQTLNDLGVSHTYYEAPGVHDWAFWDTHIQRVLDWLPV